MIISRNRTVLFIFVCVCADETLGCVFFEQLTTPCDYVSSSSDGVDWLLKHSKTFVVELCE
jgi:hypothetical protein